MFKNLLYKIENNMRTQESWCVIKGSVIAYFYDVNNKLLCTTTLRPGYASFTFEGGHSLKAITNNAIVSKIILVDNWSLHHN